VTRHPLAIPALTLALIIPVGETGRAFDEGWTPLFDGKTLDGWQVNGGTAGYTVEDGAIVGTTVEGSPNTFLCKGDYEDFELGLEVKCDPRLNSGIQVRSHVYAKDAPDPEKRKRALSMARSARSPARRPVRRGGSTTKDAGAGGWPRSGPRPGMPSTTRAGTATGSSSGGTATAPGSTGYSSPTSPTTWTRAASSAFRSTGSPGGRGRIRSAGATSASAN
jgi:hypothetical protein